MTDAELGAALRRAGLVPRAVEAAFGAGAAAGVKRRWRGLPETPATAAVRLFVGMEAVGVEDAERGLGVGVVAAAVECGLILLGDPDRGPEVVRACGPIVPIGPSLVAIGAHWPDDSSHHLIGCVPPARVGRWLDVGTGVAIAPLARPDRAEVIVAADIDRDALAHARLGVALSGVRHVEVREADLVAGCGDGFDLITFNLPIPAEAGLTAAAEGGFRHAPPGADLLARFVGDAPAHLAPGGTIVMHAWLGPTVIAIVDGLPGEVATVTYTPPGAPAFGVLRWRPEAPAAHRHGNRALTAAAPHLAWSDLDDAAA